MTLGFLELHLKSYPIFISIRSSSYSLTLFKFVKKNYFLYIYGSSQFLCYSNLKFIILIFFINQMYFTISDLVKMIEQVQLNQY